MEDAYILFSNKLCQEVLTRQSWWSEGQGQAQGQWWQGKLKVEVL